MEMPATAAHCLPPAMPVASKRACMLEEVASYYIQQKWARILHIISLTPPCNEIHSNSCLAVANLATMNGW
jgi:hypothetical protein